MQQSLPDCVVVTRVVPLQELLIMLQTGPTTDSAVGISAPRGRIDRYGVRPSLRRAGENGDRRNDRCDRVRPSLQRAGVHHVNPQHSVRGFLCLIEHGWLHASPVCQLFEPAKRVELVEYSGYPTL